MPANCADGRHVVVRYVAAYFFAFEKVFFAMSSGRLS